MVKSHKERFWLAVYPWFAVFSEFAAYPEFATYPAFAVVPSVCWYCSCWFC